MLTKTSLSFYSLLVLSSLMAHARIQEIHSLKEYEAVRSQKGPMVIVYNSSTCGACKPMEDALEKVLKEQICTKVKCYKLDLTKMDDKKKDVFKDLGKKIGIKAYPSAHIMEPGKEPRLERGAMEHRELERVVYKLENGKEMPYKKEAAAKS